MISNPSISRQTGFRAWSRRLAAVAAACVLTAAPLAAQEVDTEVPLSPPGEPPPVDLAPEEGDLHLSLEEAIAIALQRNVDLLVSRNTYQDAVFGVQGARGIFDLRLSADVSTSDRDSPTAVAVEGVPVLSSQDEAFDLSLSQLTPLGGTASLVWSNARDETNSLNVQLNPSYTSFASLGYTQPLLQNFGRTVTRNEILVAQRGEEIGRSEFERQVIATAQDVANAYWDLVEARQQLGVAEEALALAEELHQQNQIRVDVGTLAPLELVQSEAGIATQREQIILARAAVGDAADRLRLLLNLEQGPLWTAELIPDTEPTREPMEFQLADALASAQRQRVELTGQGAGVEQARLRADVARSLVRPRLDLDVSYDLSGLGGDILTRDPETGEVIGVFPGGFDDALDQVTGRDFEGWRVGLLLAYPLQNREARAGRARADIAVDSAERQHQLLQQQVATEVRTAARNLEAAWERVEAARASVRLQQRSLDAEQKRFDNGMSTSFLVLQVQNDLTAARGREVTAITGYNRAVIEYHRAIGELLQTAGIRVVGDEEAG
ncbi:MAG: TolC family protein [Thermoanaerobaculia bacterium]